MEKVLELYKYIDGVNDAKFPNDEEQVVVRDFRYDAKRMGGAPTISFSIKHSLCLDNLWDDHVYAMFNGERYYVKQTPTSSYSNEDTRYKHEVELISERTILDNVYFYDVVTTDVENDKPVSNSSKFSFFGDIHEYVKRVGYSLSWSGLDYTIEIDENIVSEEKQVSFENQVITSVLQEIYNIYQIPYYFDGKVIHVGYYKNNIDNVFKYGSQNSLLSISKTNANAKIVNRITGVGSQDNIPYYYPNNDEKGITRPLLNDSTSGVQIVSSSKYRKIRLSDRFIFNKTLQAKTSLIDENNYTLGDLRVGSFKDEKSKFIVDFLYSFTLKQGENVEFSVTSSYEDNVGLSYDMYKKGGNYIGPFVDSSRMYLSSGEYSFVVRWSFMAQGTMVEIEEKLQSLIATYLNIRAHIDIDADNTWTLNGIPVSLEHYGLQVDNPNDGDVVSIEQTSYINPQSSLMPPIYRDTLGKERFYNALNDTYVDEESGGNYKFENEYAINHPKEHIEVFEDIKPTIKNVTNKDGYRIDRFVDFAYDLYDNDEVDENGKYIHRYFFAKLHRFDGEWGFNLFDHAIDESEMIISMTSGSCGSCSFKVLVNKENQKNTVQVDEYGNLLRDNNGNVRFGSPQDKQNDTENYEVWIALEKDIQTFGVIMPNATNNYRPSAGDTFVILHIDLPKSYIEAAEKKLENELLKYMYENNFEKFNFSISFSRIFFAEQPNILANLTENSKLNVEYNGTTYELYVSSFSYAMNSSNPLPEIKVELDDVIAISQNQINQIVASTRKEILAVSNQDVFWKDIKGVPSWITSEKPQYSYNELYGRSDQEDNGVWVVKTDSNGNQYIFSTLPVVTQYGITMYADGGDLNLPSIYAGLPIDGRTLIRDDNGVLMINPDIDLGSGAATWDELEGKPTWITTNKPKWDYNSDISNTPDLSIYATYDYVDDTFIPIEGDTDVLGMKNFKKGLNIDGLGITKSQDDVIYLDANLVVRGGITMYAEGTVNIPSIIESIPTATNYRKGLASFDAEFFTVDAAGHVTLIPENVGLNEEELSIYLTENKYATQYWITSKSYAKNDDLLFLKARIDDFLEGSDTDTIINKWKELESFLSGLSESDNLATILGTKANQSDLDDTNDVVATKWTQDDIKIGNWDTAYKWGDHSKAGYALKSYVDDTFVTLATKQTITGEKNFTGGLKVNGSPIVYDATNKYWKLEGDLLVTGGVTMFASDSAFTPSTIMDAIATDNVNLKVVNGVLTFVGETGGGLTEVYWDDIKFKPTFASVATSGKYSDLSGKPTLLSSFINDEEFVTSAAIPTNLSQLNNDLGFVTGGPYLLLTGGTLSGSIRLNNGYLFGSVAHNTLPDKNGYLIVYNINNATILGAFGDGTTPNIATYIRSTGNNLYHRQGNNNAYKDYRIWDEGNDGAGSGLDADTLDGVQLSGLLTSMTYTAMKTDGTMPVISTVVGGVTKSISLGYEGLVRKGYAYCDTTLNSYWVKIASVTLPYNYDDYAATLCVECPFNSGEGSYLVKWACRTNGTTTAAPSGSVRILGSTHHDFRIYNSGAGSTTTFELWANLRERYGGIAYTVIQESDRGAVNKSELATYYNTDFTTVQTPTLTNWVDHTFDSIGNNSASATKLQTLRTIWGQSFDGSGDVTGNLTVGDGNLILNNNKSILALDANGNGTELIRMNSNPDLVIGTGIANTGYGGTYIRGGHIRLQYGSSYTNGLMLNSVGNVLIGTTTDSGYKLDVNGTFGVTGAATLKSTLSVASDTTLATKLTLNGIPIYKSQNDVLYIDGNLAVRGGITMYATDAIDVPSIIDALPSATYDTKGIAAFNPNDFSVVDGYVSFIGSGGVDESVLADYAKKTDLSKYLPISGGQMTGSISYPLEYMGNIRDLASSCVFDYTDSLTANGVIDNKRSLMGYAHNVTYDSWWNIISVRGDSNKYGMYICSSTTEYGGNLSWNRQEGYEGAWQGERVILDSHNWPQYVTANDDGNYLPLSGGTLNGTLSIGTPIPSEVGRATLGLVSVGDNPTDFKMGNGSQVWSITARNKANRQNMWFYSFLSKNILIELDATFNAVRIGRGTDSLSDYLDSEYSLDVVGPLRSNRGVFKSTSANILSLYRMDSGGGAWIDYYAYNQTSSKWRVGAGGIYDFMWEAPDGNYPCRIYYNTTLGIRFEIGQRFDAVQTQSDPTRATLTLISTSDNPTDLIMGANNYDWSITARGSSDDYFLGFYSERNGQYVTRMYRNGNVLVTGGITMYSDIRKKTKIADVELSLKQIADAPLIEHYYNSDAMRTTHVGSIAQYWAETIGNDWFCKLDNDGYYTMEIQNAALASAISIARELVKYESKTDRKIRLLKQRVKELEDKIEKLENN